MGLNNMIILLSAFNPENFVDKKGVPCVVLLIARQNSNHNNLDEGAVGLIFWQKWCWWNPLQGIPGPAAAAHHTNPWCFPVISA